LKIPRASPETTKKRACLRSNPILPDVKNNGLFLVMFFWTIQRKKGYVFLPKIISQNVKVVPLVGFVFRHIMAEP
jgi:hypothetical protein